MDLHSYVGERLAPLLISSFIQFVLKPEKPEKGLQTVGLLRLITSSIAIITTGKRNSSFKTIVSPF